MRVIINWLGRGMATILALALIIMLWTYSPSVIIRVLDFNLGFVKWSCGLLPADYSAMVEAIVRLGFPIDKALLLPEATALVKAVIAVPRALLP